METNSKQVVVDPLTGILTAGELASAIKKMTSVFPDTPKDLEDKHRWMTVTVFNQTQYTLVFAGSDFFDSGRYWTAPTNAEPFKSVTFSACNSDGSFLTGVSGAALFYLRLLKSGGGYDEVDIAMAFSNPQSGPIKSAAVLADDPKTGWKSLSSSSTNTTTDDFTGSNTEGDEETINFKIVSSPGQRASITITQNIVS